MKVLKKAGSAGLVFFAHVLVHRCYVQDYSKGAVTSYSVYPDTLSYGNTCLVA